MSDVEGGKRQEVMETGLEDRTEQRGKYQRREAELLREVLGAPSCQSL